MKNLILVLALSLIMFGCTTATGDTVEEVYCVDSDGGNDIYDFGYVIEYWEGDPDVTYFEGEDYCEGNQIFEYYCNPTPTDFSRLGVYSTTCENGCENGKCLGSQSCTSPIGEEGDYFCKQKEIIGEILKCQGGEWEFDDYCPVDIDTETNDCGTEEVKSTKEGICYRGGSCSDECQTDNIRECVTSNSYRTCGNYDADPCREYSQTNYCAGDKVCLLGNCIEPTPCENNVDCNDNNPDTLDECIDNKCRNTPQPTDYSLYFLVGGIIVIIIIIIIALAKRKKKRGR